MDNQNIIIGEEVERLIFSTLGECLNVFLKMYEDKVLQIDLETDEQQTAEQILKRAIQLSKWFKSKGIKKGDAVSIYSENRLEYSIYAIACFFIGAMIAPLNPDYTLGELQHVVKLSKPKVVCCSPITINKLLEVLPKNNYIQYVILLGKEKLNNRHVLMHEDIIKGHENIDVDSFRPDEVDVDNTVAAVLTSSGTTGLPKGVMITHSNITNYMDMARHLVDDFNLGAASEGTSISLTPLFHSYGFLTMILNLIRGMKVVVMRKFILRKFFETIQNHKVTFLTIPPPVLLLIVKHPVAKHYDLSSLKDIRCGAAPLGKELEEEVDKRLTTPVSQAYGMTETTLGVLVNRYGAKKLGSVGTIIPGMMCKVIDENGNTLGPYQEGELCFKGSLIMKGYIGDPASTAATIDKDNWLHTGDIGYYDNEKYFYIVDRIKELIKYKGFQVAPAELEAILISHDEIADAAVVGLEDEVAGELPLAYIVKKPGSKISEKEIQDFIAGKVSPQKRLRGGVIFTDEIPRNTTGKILRRVLKQRTKKLVSKL